MFVKYLINFEKFMWRIKYSWIFQICIFFEKIKLQNYNFLTNNIVSVKDAKVLQ